MQYVIKTSKGYPKMNEEIKVLIDRHYEDGDLSKQAPKIKDFVLIRKEGEMKRIQKKYLPIALEK